MSGERLDVWEDQGTKAALQQGRELSDIAVLNCPRCGKFGYYNEGSSFFCRHCQVGFYCATEEETYDELLWEPRGGIIVLDMHLTLEDVLYAECSDYP